MDIGILSMQQVANYGSFLQAYGLKSTLEQLGHRVEFIDIIPGEQLPEYKQGKMAKLRKGFSRLNCLNPFKMVYYSLLLHKRFAKEFIPALYSGNRQNQPRFDCVVVGSDEVFNIAQSTWFGFAPQLFGEGLNAHKVISYAACCGAMTVEKLSELGLTERVRELLKGNFSAISVRDLNSFNLVKELTGDSPEMNIDPVLLYEFPKELPVSVAHSGSKYMIIYTYPNRMRNKTEISAIKAYARKHQLRIISMGDYFDWVDEVVTPTPFEVLAYFREATCVVTDTFHGTVMSMKYNKRFATIVRDMNSNKLTGLLGQFGLDGRIVSEMGQLDAILDSAIDYTPVNQQIAEERRRSIDYLKANL